MIDLFQYQYFTNGILAALLVSISCGFIGTYIVSRRIVFVSGGISHAAFGGVGIAYFLGLNPLLGAAVFSVAAAVGIEVMSHKTPVREDSLIGMMWSLGMAVGILFVFLTPGYAANLMSFLFGDILTVSGFDLWLMGCLVVVILLVFALRYRRILYIAFDPEFARTQTVNVRGNRILMMVLVALTVVVNIRVVGIILVISLMTIPPAAANLLVRDFRHMILLSGLFSLIASFGGLMASHLLNVPSGASIVFSAALVFFVVKTGLRLGFFAKKRYPPAE